MKIKCPKCASEYNFPEDKLKPEGTKVRCTSCATVFLVRSRGADSTPSKPPTPSPPLTSSPAAASDDLGAFFGSVAPGKPAPTPAAKDNIDDLFGDGGDVLGDSPEDDLFGKPAADSLFGSDEDLFAAKPAAKADSADDLFGDGGDLFADQPSSPAVAKPKAPAAPPPPASANFGASDDLDSDEDALHSLFDDSDAGAKPSKPAKAPTKAATPAQAKAKPAEKAPPAKKASPDFDWDDDQDSAKADEAPAFDAPPPAEFGDAEFTPAIRQDDAEQVLEQTLIRETVARQAPKPRYGLIVLMVLLLSALGTGAFFALNPESLDHLLIRAGLREPPKPQVFTSPIVPEGAPQTSLVQNRNGYSIFVVEGQLRNGDTVPHSFIQLRVNLLNQSGTMVTDTVVFAGNSLSPLQLKNFPNDELLRLLRVEMGESLRNFNVKPGALVPYTAIFAPAPEAYADLSIKAVVLGSARGER